MTPIAANRPCVPLLVVGAAGLWIGRQPLPFGLAQWCGLGLAALAAWWLLGPSRTRRASLVLSLAVACLAAAWSHDRWNVFGADDLSWSLDELARPVSVEAVVVRGPRHSPAPPSQPLAAIPRGEETRLVIRVHGVRAGRRWISASGTAMLSVDGQLVGIHAGDRIRVHATAWIPGRPLNPGESDYAAYLRGRRQLCRLRAPHPDAVVRLAAGSHLSPRRVLDDVRRRGQVWLERHIPREQTGLALAVLLGAREGLDEHRSDAFFQSGLAHLLAVSGLNVAIFAYGFWFIARIGWLPRRVSIVVVAGLAVLYAVLTDAEPPVLRAALLVVGSAIGRWSGRMVSGENSLAAAACLVLVFDPASLWQVGAQLSFLAVAVLDRLAHATPDPEDHDPLDQLLARSRPWPLRMFRNVAFWIWESIVTSTLIWLVTLPLVLHRFHVISPIALVLNPIVMLPMTLAMYSGAAAMLLAGIWPAAGDVLGYGCAACLTFIEWAIARGLAVPGNHVWLPSPSATWVAAFYLVGAIYMVRPEWAPPMRWRWACLGVWLAWGSTTWLPPLSTWFTSEPPHGPTRVTLISVGHGTSALVELPDGRTLLYDGGRLGSPATAGRAIEGVLWSKGLTHLDAMIISHADTDHYNAVPDLCERFSIGVVYVSGAMIDQSNPALDVLWRSLARAGVSIRQLAAGDRLAAGADVSLDIWHPPDPPGAGSDNSHSIVLAVEHGPWRLLLPGDLESPGLDQLLAGAARPCDVIMAPHHGSSRSKPRGFAHWTSPRYAIVSGSLRHDDSDVRRAYESVGAHVFHTAKDGAIEVTMDRERVRVRSFRGKL